MANQRLSKLQKEILRELSYEEHFDCLKDKTYEHSQYLREKEGVKMDCMDYHTLLKNVGLKLGIAIIGCSSPSPQHWEAVFGDEYPVFTPSFCRSLKNLESKNLIERAFKKIMYEKSGTQKVWLTEKGMEIVKSLNIIP